MRGGSSGRRRAPMCSPTRSPSGSSVISPSMLSIRRSASSSTRPTFRRACASPSNARSSVTTSAATSTARQISAWPMRWRPRPRYRGLGSAASLRTSTCPVSRDARPKIVDGGAYDNMGLEVIDGLVREELIIAINAGGLFYVRTRLRPDSCDPRSLALEQHPLPPVDGAAAARDGRAVSRLGGGARQGVSSRRGRGEASSSGSRRRSQHPNAEWADRAARDARSYPRSPA